MRDDKFTTTSGIVNLHSTNETHWVMFVNMFYFDSYGCPPPTNIINHIKKGIYSENCKIRSEKYPDDGIECDYDRDNYDQAYSEIENFYHLKSETNLLNPFIDLHKFRRSYNFFIYLSYPNKMITLRVNQSV